MDERDKKFRTQWGERGNRAPVFKNKITLAEIEQWRAALALSYKCPIDDINYTFDGIRHAHDDDRIDHIYIVFMQMRYSARKHIPHSEEIWRVKILLDEEIRSRSRMNAKTAASLGRALVPTSRPVTPQVVSIPDPSTAPVAPRRRKVN